MPTNTTPERTEAPDETAAGRVLATLKVAAKIPLALAAVALPIALATPAHATTASTNAATINAGCTMKVHNPVSGGTNIFTGNKLVTYKVTVSCPVQLPPGVYVQVEQKFYERDSTVDEYLGKVTSYQVMPIGGNHTFSVTRNVPDTEAGSEELVQKARFFAVSLPVPSGIQYAPYVYSGVTSLSN
jgi:hypothetical protein